MQTSAEPVWSSSKWSKLVLKGFRQIKRRNRRVKKKIQKDDLFCGTTKRVNKKQRSGTCGFG